MLLRCKSVVSASGVRRSLAILFVLSILNSVAYPLFTLYWLRDNNGPPLTPDVDYRLRWIPDDEFRGLDAAKGPIYAVPGDGKVYAAGATWQAFRPYYVRTPDGNWHLEVLAQGPLAPYALRAYFLGAFPSVLFSIFGLLICLYGLKADSSTKDKAPDSAFQDLS